MTLDTIDGHANARGLGHHLGSCWYLKATLPRGHTDLNGLCHYLGPWWHLTPGLCQGPLWIQGIATAGDLCWCLWPKAIWMPGVLAATCGYVHVQGICYCHGHGHLSSLCYHVVPWCHPGQRCCHRPFLGLQSDLILLYICLRSGEQHKNMLVCKGHPGLPPRPMVTSVA